MDGKDATASLGDRRVEALQSAAGTTEAVNRGKLIGGAIVVVGMLGAVGVAFRPIYTKAFAARAVVQRTAAEARRATQGLSPADEVRLEKLTVRLHELQTAQRERHPLWFPSSSGEAPAMAEGKAAASRSNASV